MDFRATFTAVAFLSIISSACSDSCSLFTIILKPSVGSPSIITSPNYPSYYPTRSTTCKWRITARFGYRVKIKFTSFSTAGSAGSCSMISNDYLEVFDTYYASSTKRLGKYCGSSLPPILVSSGRDMYLKFSTYSYSARQGFRLEYSVVDKQYGCGSSLVSADSITTKIITSPNYPNNYPSSTSCQWTITAPSGYVVQIKFTNFNTYGSITGSCSSSSDKLYIYDSSSAQSSKLLGQYCGSFLPANVVSRQKSLFLKFSTGSTSFSKTGFRIEYKAVKDPSEDYSTCSPFNYDSTNNDIKLKASSSYKYIKSPYYPNKYPSNIKCIWIISASSSSKRVKLTLTDVNIYNYYSYSCSSTGDSLTIRDGSYSWSTQLKQFCTKSSSSTTVTSKGQKLWIQFKTNSDNYFTSSSQAGFQVKFIEVEDSSSIVGMIVGILFGVVTFIGLIVCCVCISKRKRSAGHVQSNAAATSVQTTTTSTHPPPPAAPQYPLQQVGGYQPPPPGGSYPPPAMGYPHPSGGFPPPTEGYLPPTAPQDDYPPSASGYLPYPSSDIPDIPPPPYPDVPPPPYPGPPGHPAQSGQPYNPQFQGGQPNPPYPPPQGSENQAAAVATYPPSQDTKASAPPQC